jgi:hypothetical protein
MIRKRSSSVGGRFRARCAQLSLVFSQQKLPSHSRHCKAPSWNPLLLMTKNSCSERNFEELAETWARHLFMRTGGKPCGSEDRAIQRISRLEKPRDSGAQTMRVSLAVPTDSQLRRCRWCSRSRVHAQAGDRCIDCPGIGRWLTL